MSVGATARSVLINRHPARFLAASTFQLVPRLTCQLVCLAVLGLAALLRIRQQATDQHRMRHSVQCRDLRTKQKMMSSFAHHGEVSAIWISSSWSRAPLSEEPPLRTARDAFPAAERPITVSIALCAFRLVVSCP